MCLLPMDVGAIVSDVGVCTYINMFILDCGKSELKEKNRNMEEISRVVLVGEE